VDQLVDFRKMLIGPLDDLFGKGLDLIVRLILCPEMLQDNSGWFLFSYILL